MCYRLAVSQGSLTQLRARLVSLREQRNRMIHRGSEMERRAAAEGQRARLELENAREKLLTSQADAVNARRELDAFERDKPRPGTTKNDRGPEWQAAWEDANARLRQAQAMRGAVEAVAADAEERLRRALGDQEAASADHARALTEIEHELDGLMREISRLQAEQPLPEAPDPRLRDKLLDRLQHLEAERVWIAEEISLRQERLHRISVEANHIRSLLEIHTPDWGRDALSALAPEASLDRSGPAWRQTVVEILERTSEPMHYREIADQLGGLGKGLGGQDPAETLLAALGRDPEFERVGRGVYWLKSRPLPAAWRGKRSGGP